MTNLAVVPLQTYPVDDEKTFPRRRFRKRSRRNNRTTTQNFYDIPGPMRCAKSPSISQQQRIKTRNYKGSKAASAVGFFPQFPGVSAETLPATMAAIAPEVDISTAVTQWRGEDCDYGMAVDALLARDGVLSPSE